MLGQGILATRLTQAIDYFNGDNVGGCDGLLVVRQIAGDDLIQLQELPEPACQPDIAKASTVGPGDLVEADPGDVRIVRTRDIVLREEE